MPTRVEIARAYFLDTHLPTRIDIARVWFLGVPKVPTRVQIAHVGFYAEHVYTPISPVVATFIVWTGAEWIQLLGTIVEWDGSEWLPARMSP